MDHNRTIATIVHNTVYYLPGYGGQLATGLGQGLRDRGLNVAGRETRDDFRTLPFDAQVQTIGQHLREHFWHERARVVCNLFGAYLFQNDGWRETSLAIEFPFESLDSNDVWLDIGDIWREPENWPAGDVRTDEQSFFINPDVEVLLEKIGSKTV